VTGHLPPAADGDADLPMGPPPDLLSDPLTAPLPTIGRAAAARLAETAFGIRGTVAELGGERDRNLRIDAEDGHSYVLKVSNRADGVEALDLQSHALRHLERYGPDLPVMKLVPSLEGADWVVGTGADGTPHLVRLFTLVPGRRAQPEELDHTALQAFGGVVARMGQALRGFFHPAARYEILWDLRHAARLRPLLPEVGDRQRRGLAERVLDRFDERVAPAFGALRAQVIHNDLTLDNVLLDDRARVSGVVDLGDLTHTALVSDLAIVLAGLMWRRPDPIETARSVIAGYVGVTPLDGDEAQLLGDLVAIRLTAWGVIAAWRANSHPENEAYITSGEDDAWELLGHLESLGRDEVTRRLARAALGHAVPYRPAPSGELAVRRSRVLGASPLAYREPLHLVSGDGVWMLDADGRRYLDAYNNVPVVGHAHPSVSSAIAAQSRTLATNTRYLHEAAVTLAERLVGTLPAGLDTVVFVNSGSEANDLAWRFATAVTGRRGALVSARAYHGVTEATTALSPEVWPADELPAHVGRFDPPIGDPTDAASSQRTLGRSVEDAVVALEARGMPPAALFLEPAFTSDGILAPPAEGLRQVADVIGRAGGLLVVDEVQAGHGRCGADLWAFQASGIVPDVVTMGKPMGNGHPVAAVVTRSEIASTLMDRMELFSTFGGNPVSCVAALAVLDVIEGEGLIGRAADVGAYLRGSLRELAARHDRVGAVRGSGLLIGVDLLDGAAAGSPASGEEAARVVDGLRRRGVLVGATGPHGNVLKIRPPLVFDRGHADLLVEALDATISGGQARD
jgi:4-aminobutyrate aminotransferase-like enzyme/Ser/Thr protein kinase RdoA (MazF antagonist)